EESTLIWATRSAAEIVAAARETSSADGGGEIAAHEAAARRSVRVLFIARRWVHEVVSLPQRRAPLPAPEKGHKPPMLGVEWFERTRPAPAEPREEDSMHVIRAVISRRSSIAVALSACMLLPLSVFGQEAAPPGPDEQCQDIVLPDGTV